MITKVIEAIDRIKTCYRCGGAVASESVRLCAICRKARGRARGEGADNMYLTFREKQVVELISQAKLNKEIAVELHLTEGTIKEYLNRIFRKLQVKNRTELAIWAMRHGETAA